MVEVIGDTRNKRRRPNVKYAIDRDGDLFLVECPVCHFEDALHYNGEFFECCRGIHCESRFLVDTEDGVFSFLDHREGEVPLPTRVLKFDEEWHCGIDESVFWFLPSRIIYKRDLIGTTGKDCHGHNYYRILPRFEKQNTNDGCASS